MSVPALLTAARAAIAALWPGATDRTGDAYDAPEAGLPAFAFEAAVEESAPVSMGSAEVEDRGTLTLTLTVAAGAVADLAGALHLCADAAEAVLAADPAVTAAVLDLSPSGRSVEIAAGQGRLGRLVLGFGFVTVGPEPGAAAPPEINLG